MKKACIFCQIIAGEAEASHIYEDEHLVAIMDAYPLSEGHVLVIPKQHHVRLSEFDGDMQHRLFTLGHKIVEAQKKLGLGVEGTNLLLNDGKAANQTVPHLHLHLIPRKKNDFLKSIPKIMLHMIGVFGFNIQREKLDDLAKRIRASLV